MEGNKMLKLAYTFFLGILLALFVGVGINTFYPGPTAPEFPAELNSYGKELTTEQAAVQRNFDKRMEQFNKDMQPYNRNVSMLALGAAVVFLAVSLAFEKRIKLIADGGMFGGLFTLLYSVGRGFASQDSKYMFIVISAGLVIVLYLGYRRFVRHGATAKTA
jgi:biotin-(acetyl-CoA carboxylase) ligase